MRITVGNQVEANIPGGVVINSGNVTASIPGGVTVNSGHVSADVTGNVNANITNSKLAVDANITNSTLNANITNASINANVTGDVNITGGSINVTSDATRIIGQTNVTEELILLNGQTITTSREWDLFFNTAKTVGIGLVVHELGAGTRLQLMLVQTPSSTWIPISKYFSTYIDDTGEYGWVFNTYTKRFYIGLYIQGATPSAKISLAVIKRG